MWAHLLGLIARNTKTCPLLPLQLGPGQAHEISVLKAATCNVLERCEDSRTFVLLRRSDVSLNDKDYNNIKTVG